MNDQNAGDILSTLVKSLGDGDSSEEPDEDEESFEFEGERDGGPLIQKAQLGIVEGAIDTSQEEYPYGMLMELPLEISVELGRTEVGTQNFLRLRTGSVIELDKLAGEPVDLFVSGRKFAVGEVVVVGDSFGIRITRLVDKERSSAD